jgi:hypothetical protein
VQGVQFRIIIIDFISLVSIGTVWVSKVGVELIVTFWIF